MPKRPTFWIHRTKRFWFGLGLLIASVAGSLAVGCYQSTFTKYGSSSAGPSRPLATPPVVITRIGFEDGGFIIERIASGAYIAHRIAARSSGWVWRTGQRYGYKYVPSFEKNRRGFTLFIPGTIPILLTCLLWPLWMHRADKREMALYESED